MKKSTPFLVTMGDPNGVGPEIIAKWWSSGEQPRTAQFVVVGDKKVMAQAVEQFASSLQIAEVGELSEALNLPHQTVPVWEGGVSMRGELRPGTTDAEAGAAAIGWVHAAVKAIQMGAAAGMVTAPLSKEAVEPTVPGFSGHTEYIGALCGDPEPVLSLFHGSWVVAHVSTHLSLRDAIDRVQQPRILKTARLLEAALKKVGIPSPRIGVAGLNPHAGEGGLFGREEIDQIAPAVAQLRAEGMDVSGPLPGDVVFPQMKAGRFDGVVAMYHDQGHVVTKTIGFELGEERLLHGVNATLGLPIVRTSVDHGTGFDIAWSGVADWHSLHDAALLAIDLV